MDLHKNAFSLIRTSFTMTDFIEDEIEHQKLTTCLVPIWCDKFILAVSGEQIHYAFEQPLGYAR